MKPLKPVMAALLAASSATFALPGISFANNGPVNGPVNTAPAGVNPGVTANLIVPTGVTCPPSATDTNPVNALTCVIAADPVARKDIGERFARFVAGKDASGRQYMKAELLADTTLLPPALAIAKAWPEANKAKPGRIAVLYFVMGPDAALPAWAAQNAVLGKTLKPAMTWSTRLAEALATKQHWTDTKQIAQSGAAEATTAFFNDAAAQAQIVLDDPRTKKEIQLSVDANDTTAVKPPTTGNGANPLDATGAGFSFDDLYKKGAEVANIYNPNDKGFRTLSMKIYTTLDANKNPISQVGVVDITANDITSPSLPQFIDVSKPGDTDIVMRDGGRHYTVTVGTDGSVVLKRAGSKDGDGGGRLATTAGQLSSERDAQIMSSGAVVIPPPPAPGGQPYYVLGQGGAKGTFLFFSQSQMQRAPNGNAHPELMGDVAQVIGDGTTAPIKGNIDIGQLQDGTYWHLEFDMTTRMWKVVKGQATPPSTSTTTTGGTTTTPPAGSTTTTTVPTTDPTTDPTSATTLAQAIDIAKADKPDKTQVWVEDAGNAGLDPAVLAQLRIMSNKQQDNMTHFKVLFDPSLDVNDPRIAPAKNNSFEFLPISQNVRLLHIRGVKKFIALAYATNTQYYDLPNFVNYVKHVYDASLSYQQAGSFSTSNGQMQTVTSVDIMEDVLTHSLKVPKDSPMLATLRARVAKNAKDSGYVINGDTTTIYLGYGESGMTIWPNEIAAGDHGTNDGMTGLRGPGTAVSLTGGERGDFKPEMDMGSGRTATLVKKDNHAAIYTATEDENVGGTIKPSKVWYIMIEYKKNNLDSRSKALPVFGGQSRYQLPSGYQIQGLPDLNLPDTTQLAMLYGSSQEKGAIVAYRTTLPDGQGGSNVRDKAANCAGPVIWWGSVTKEQAQAACAGNSKVP